MKALTPEAITTNSSPPYLATMSVSLTVLSMVSPPAGGVVAGQMAVGVVVLLEVVDVQQQQRETAITRVGALDLADSCWTKKRWL